MTQTTLNPQRAEVERIVREVLANLASVGAERPRTTSLSAVSASATGPVSATRPVAGELVLSNKVISAAQLKDRLEGISRIVVPRGAILTPAARDELRERNISVASAVETAKQNDAARVALATAETTFNPAGLITTVSAAGLKVERLSPADLLGAIDGLCQLVATNEALAVLLTGQPAAALCLANRQPRVRAVLGYRVEVVAADTVAVGGNLIVIDPQGKSFFELARMIREFAGAAGPCPAPWQARLG